MRHHVRHRAIAIATILSAGCTGDPHGPGVAPTADGLPEAASAARVVNPRAVFSYSHFPTGIAGDGRAADGSPSTGMESVYEDGRCGVTSEIFASGSRDATMDPIGSKTVKNCVTSARRALVVTWGTPLSGASLPPAEGGHFSNVRAVLDLAVGGSAERLFTLLLRGGHTCERVRYDANVTYTVDGTTYGGSRVIVSRLSATEWVAESQPNAQGKHVGFCQVGGSGGVGDFYDPGAQLGAYEMPLRLTVRQK